MATAEFGDGLHRIALADGQRAVIKCRRDAPRGFFAAEADGLERLRTAGTLRVPLVQEFGETAIVLEDLGHGQPTQADWERAGQDLARLHRVTSVQFGLDRSGWCGDSPQLNTPMPDGWRFFAECRLLPQGRRARDAGRLDARDLQALERLCAALPGRIPLQPASLVHGDLWRANLHPCANGELALIDAAAVHYGWAEADLAMLTLFGAPPVALFAAYEAESGIDSGWSARAPLYNLYHLLNHLNLFGPGYLEDVRAVLRCRRRASPPRA